MKVPRLGALVAGALAVVLVVAVAHHAIASFVVQGAASVASGYTIRFDDMQLGGDHASFSGLRAWAPNGDEVATVRRIDVDYHLRDLLPGGKRLFGLVAVRVDRPVVTLERLRDGTFDVRVPAGGAGGGGGPPARLSVRVRDGEVRLVDDAPLEPDLARQSLVDLDVDARIDTAARTVATLRATLLGRRRQGAPLQAYPIAVRSTSDAARGYSATRLRIPQLPLRGLVNFLVHQPAVRFDDGVFDGLDVLAYTIGAPGAAAALQLGGGGTLSGVRVESPVLARSIRDLHGRVDLFDDGVTTPRLDAVAAGVPLQIRGGLYDFAHLQFRIGIRGDAELAHLKALFPFLNAQPVRGGLHLEALIAGSAADPLIRTKLVGEHVWYGAIPIHRLHGIVDYAQDAVTFTGVHAGFGPLDATLNGTVDLHGPDAAIEAFVAAGGPAAAIPYAQEVVSDARIDALAVVGGTGRGGYRIGGTVTAVGPHSAGGGFVAVDQQGRGEFGPFVFDRADGSSLTGGFRLDRPTSSAAGWLAARGYRLDIPPRVAALPGIDLPSFPQVGGRIDAQIVAGGPPSAFAIAGRVHATGAGYRQYPIGTVDLGLAGTLSDLRLADVRVAGPIGRFRGGGDVVDGRFALAGDYDGSLEALAPFTGDIGAHGAVRAPVSALIDGRGLTVQTAGAALAGASIHGIPIDRAAGTLAVDAGGVRILAAHADIDGTPAVAAGAGREMVVSVTDVPARALVGAGLPLRAGRVSLFGLADLRGPHFRGSVDLAGGEANGGYPVGGWVDVTFAGSAVELHDGVASLGSTYGSIGGRIGGLDATPQFDLTAVIPLGDVGSVAGALRLPVRYLDGSFGARLRLTGTVPAPQVDGSVDVPEGSYNGLAFSAGSGSLSLTVGGGVRLALADGRLRVHATPLRFDGAIGPGALAFHVSSTAANLVDFDDYFDESGTLAGSGPFQLALSDDADGLRTDGRLAFSGTRVRRYPLGDVRAAWGMRGRTIVGVLTSTAPSGRLAASMAIAPARGSLQHAFLAAGYNGDLTADDVDLARWSAAFGTPVPLLGRLDADEHVQGVFPRIAIGGQASVVGGRIGRYAIASATARTHIVGDRVSIDDAGVDLGFARLSATGVVGLGLTEPLALHAHLSVPDLAAAARAFSRNAPDIAGSLEADTVLAGTFAVPTFTVGFDLESPRYGAFSVSKIVGSLATDLHTLRLNSAEIGLGAGRAEFAGELPIRLTPLGVGPPDAPIALTAQATDVDLAPLGPLVPGGGTKLAGTLNGGLEIRGTVAAPVLLGSAALTGGGYVSAIETSPIRNLAARLTFDGTTVALEALHADVGSGTLDGSGQLQLALGNTPPGGYSIDLVAHGAQFNLPEYGSGQIDGRAALVSGAQRPRLSGDLTLSNTTVPFAAIFRATGPRTETGPPFDLGLDLRLTAGKNVSVRSAIINVGTTGTIGLTGSLLDPRADGVLVATKGGYFSTYQQLFRIEQATVTFDPAAGIVPNLDLRATAHVSNPDPDTTRNTIGSADVTVAVTGPADAYSISYTSVPPYSQTQILALLAAIPLVGVVNFDQPQAVGTLRGAPGESNVLLPPGVTPYQTGVYTFQQTAFSLLNTQLTQRFLSPLETAAGGFLGLTDLDLTLDYGGRVGYTASKEISAKRNLSVTLGQVLSYPVRTQVGFSARPDAVTTASFTYFQQNGTPSYQNSIFGTSGTVQVQNGVQPLSNRQGFSAVITRRYP